MIDLGVNLGYNYGNCILTNGACVGKGTEIERRFLVSNFTGKFPYDSPKFFIRQGYIEVPMSGKSFRIRTIDNQRAILTIKAGKGIARGEHENDVSIDFGRDALEIASHKLEKVRYKIGRWEVDFYRPPLDGLVVAEIELSSIDEKFDLPQWMQGAKEVTDSLTNHHLARLATELRDNGVPALPFIYSYGLSSISKIVVTGGPGSGKSTFIKDFRERSKDIRFVPEVATLVINELKIRPSGALTGKKFQRFLNDVQKLFEVTSSQYALLEDRRAVVFDRGTVDGAAYLDKGVDEFERFFGVKIEGEYARYDLVICLDVPPPDIYEKIKSNNSARSEDYSAARKLGDKIKEVWQNHPNFVFISNDGGWEEKVRKAEATIAKVLI